MTCKKLKAFTLVELAIVLVIIGLLTAGVVGGQSLIESAKVNSQIAQFNGYTTAFRAFELEYGAKPGDMKNADQYWTGAVNGDGDKYIEPAGGATSYDLSPYATWSGQVEFSAVFQHLQLAEITHDQFGIADQFGQGGIPNLKLSNTGGWFIGGVGNMTATRSPSTTTYPRNFMNAIFIVFCNTSATGVSHTWDNGNDCFTAKQAKALDEKIDDGLPKIGKYLSFAGPGGSCLNGSENYNLSASNIKRCQGVYAFD